MRSTRRPPIFVWPSFPWAHFRTTKAAVKMHTLAIVKKRLKLEASLYTLLQVLSVRLVRSYCIARKCGTPMYVSVSS